MVEFEQAAEAFAGVDLAGCAANPVCCCREEKQVALTLVVPLFMIMSDVVREDVAKRRLAEQDQLGEALLFDGAIPSFQMGV